MNRSWGKTKDNIIRISLFPQERNILLDEIIRRHSQHDNVVEDLSTDVQVLEAQRVRLTLLEEKIKEVLAMLRSLNSMVKYRESPPIIRISALNLKPFQNISSKTLGQLVLDAVERSVDPLTGEIQVFKFLSHLYQSARDYERMTTESRIHTALRAVEAHSHTLSAIEAAALPSPPKRSTSLPPQLRAQPPSSSSEEKKKSVYRIDV